MSNRAVLLESASQVEQILRLIGNAPVHFFAANAGAAWALETRGISYHRPEEFQQGLAESTLRWLELQVKWANAMDDALARLVPEMRAPSFRPVRYGLNAIKLIWDSLVQRVFILNGLAKKLELTELIYFGGDGDKMVFNDSLELEGSVYVGVIEDWAKERGVSLQRMKAVSRDEWWGMRQAPFGGVKGFIAKTISPRLLRKSVSLTRCMERSWQTGRCSSGNQSLIFDFRYDLVGTTATILRSRQWNLIPIENVLKNIRKRIPCWENKVSLLRCWSLLDADPDFWPVGNAGPIREGLGKLIKEFLLNQIPLLWGAYQGAQQVLKESNPRGIVFCGASDFISLSLLMAARAKGIPLILYQHGTALGDIDNPFWQMWDRFLGDRLLLYGPGEKEYLMGRAPLEETKMTLDVVGSARLERHTSPLNRSTRESLRRKLVGRHHRKPLVLYVPGVFYNNHFRINWSTYRDVTLLDVRRRVAEFFQAVEGVEFLYKPFLSQGDDPSLEMLSTVCPRHHVAYHRSLPEIQWAVDLLIHELPSTGMVEGLLTDKPMVILADAERDRMTPEGKLLLARRAQLAETPDAFLEEIKRTIRGNDFAPIPRPNRDYVKKYALFLDDGRSAERAAQAIDAAVGIHP